MADRMAQIVFVDDESNVLEAFERMLHAHSRMWKCHFCSNADDAEVVASTIDVDVVVTDVRMPGRDGFELLKALRASKRTQRVPVIVVTGDSDRRLKRKALDLGATDLLNKPVNLEDLLARIRSALLLKAYEDRLAGQVETLDGIVRERTWKLETAQREVVASGKGMRVSG